MRQEAGTFRLDLAATASFGIAQVATTSFEAALAEADARMYAAKSAAGRR